MNTYRFYIKMYRDVDAKTPEEADKRIDEEMEEDRTELDDSLRHFCVIEGVHDNKPELK